MSKTRIYIPAQAISAVLEIKEKDAMHKLRDVLRLEAGAQVYVFDGCGREYSYTVDEVSKNSVKLNQSGKARYDPLTPNSAAFCKIKSTLSSRNKGKPRNTRLSVSGS